MGCLLQDDFYRSQAIRLHEIQMRAGKHIVFKLTDKQRTLLLTGQRSISHAEGFLLAQDGHAIRTPTQGNGTSKGAIHATLLCQILRLVHLV